MLHGTMPLPRLLGRLFERGDAIAAALSLPHPESRWNRCYGSEGLREDEAQRAARFDRLQRPFVLRWSDRLVIRIVPREQISRALYVSGTYEPNALVVLRSLLREGDIFVDVGANVGVFSLVASGWVGPAGHVIAFEPSSREFSRLGLEFQSLYGKALPYNHSGWSHFEVVPGRRISIYRLNAPPSDDIKLVCWLITAKSLVKYPLQMADIPLPPAK